MIDGVLSNSQSVLALLEKAFAIATALVTVASAIAALTPTPRDDRFLGKLYRVIEALALNFGHSKEQAPNRRSSGLTNS